MLGQQCSTPGGVRVNYPQDGLWWSMVLRRHSISFHTALRVNLVTPGQTPLVRCRTRPRFFVVPPTLDMLCKTWLYYVCLARARLAVPIRRCSSMAEQLFCKQQVVSSILTIGSHVLLGGGNGCRSFWAVTEVAKRD